MPLIAELHLSPMSGMDLLKQLRLNDPNSMVLLNTGFPPTSADIEAMRLGAFEFLRKETLNFDLRPIFDKALRAQQYAGGGALHMIRVDKEQGISCNRFERGVIAPLIQPFRPGLTHTAGHDGVGIAQHH